MVPEQTRAILSAAKAIPVSRGSAVAKAMGVRSGKMFTLSLGIDPLKELLRWLAGEDVGQPQF
jgi:hypothetical protein